MLDLSWYTAFSESIIADITLNAASGISRMVRDEVVYEPTIDSKTLAMFSTECAVCLEECTQPADLDKACQKLVLISNCKHTFHKFCIERWADESKMRKLRETSCPNCRREIGNFKCYDLTKVVVQNNLSTNIPEPELFDVEIDDGVSSMCDAPVAVARRVAGCFFSICL